MKTPHAMDMVSVVLAIAAFVGAVLITRYVSLEELKAIAGEQRLLAASLLALLMFATTVIAPLVSLPLVPMVAPILGPFTTGLASFVGWTLGSIAAFLIGREFGKPLVGRFIDLESLRKYETYLEPNMSFLLIVMLRMTVPVDVLSYALGIFTNVSLFTYTTATMLGIVWFAFAFSYLGEAFMGGNYVLFTVIGVASVVILYISWRYVKKQIADKK